MDAEHNKANANQCAGDTDDKCVFCVSKTIQNAVHGNAQKDKRTQPCQCLDINACHLIVEYFFSNKNTKIKKEKGEEKSEQHTQKEADDNCVMNILVTPLLLGFGDGWQQHDGDRVCNNGREENHRNRHTAVNAIDGECLCIGETKGTQAHGYHNIFKTVDKVQ